MDLKTRIEKLKETELELVNNVNALYRQIDEAKTKLIQVQGALIELTAIENESSGVSK